MSADDYEQLGGGFYWQEMKVGRKFRTIGRSIFESDLISFIGVTGMGEVLFNNLEYIEHESPTGKRIVPGALALSIAEGMVMQSTLQNTGFAFLSMTMDIKGPVCVGDTLHVDLEVTESRAASRGNRGLVRTVNKIINQNGECAIEYSPLRLMKGQEE
jgi:acyl dehydratase